ncbi:MAG TPA: dehydrogenase [Planctomycetaceae bacterium]|nr:dehydrogenase [Planctomycetaceae bacterium]
MKMRKVKAAVLYEIDKPLVIDEVEVPDLEHGQVLVDIKCSGLCHKQLEEMTGKRGNDPHLPHLLGHEGAGIVEEVGPSVTYVKPGDHVVLGWMKGQGIDSAPPFYSKLGKPVNAGWITTFNEMAVISENRITPIRKDMPFDVAALLGCAVTTGLGVVSRIAKMEPGGKVVVFGIGGIGLNVVQSAALFGAVQVIAVDVNDDKLALAQCIGATHTVNATDGGEIDRVLELTSGEGADYCFEAVGDVRVMERAYQVTGSKGLTVLMGVPKSGDKLCVDPIPLYLGRRLTGCHGGDTVKEEDIPHCVDMYLAGKLKLDELITERIKLEEINASFERMKEKKLVGRSVIEFD